MRHERYIRTMRPVMKPVSRRSVLLSALASACVQPAFAAQPRFEEVAPGIFIRSGLDEEVSAANDGAIANIGFIVGDDSVAVWDTGGSRSDGERLRAAIREHTKLPVRFVILTHAHPDHVFGTAAFLADGPQIIGHTRLTAALARRGDYYRARAEAELGPSRVGKVIAPTRRVEGRLDIDLGKRVLTLTAHPIAHTDNDLSAVDQRTGTLLASDLLFVRRVPALDGSLRGWLAELRKLQALPAKRAVPGHGPAGVDWPTAADALERYLNVLLTETRAAISKGIPIEQAVEVVGKSERAHWTLFDDYHGRNVTKAFKELEWE
jgi:quinoprotein relay system zinc metallohydrolase 2